MSVDTPDPDRPGPGAVPPGADPPGGRPTTPYPDRGPATGPGPGSLTWYGVPPAVEAPQEPFRPRLGWAAVGAFGVMLLGVPLGLLWAGLAPDTPVVKTTSGAVYGEPQPEQPFAADGWFSLLGLGFGVLAAVGLWFLLRRSRGPVGLAAAVLGSLGAALVAWQVGRRVGLATFEHLLATAADGQTFGQPAQLRAGGVEWVGLLPVPYGNVLVPALGAAIGYTLLAGWSRWPSLRPGPMPDRSDRPGVSWASGAPPTPSAAPEPPAPGVAEPPRG
ncbi:DUF2567 domain-containing protein [Salinispora arenicola]|uniref:DUF2567 domain-containing protein n=1 Tax=Salinispora arenicola TaxID=168697 RepID=UPI001699A678|nr:DUF2567 domain-containing protein [Salinispora arenicola]NIL56785.1 DUF2567 domain-containing protein [Salinispora arenicola]NIL60329.1 DUF2567 domain-containing protein [Salinispora arenicola]